jgi:predicted nucleotidyltransferase component of viral defense system
MISDRYKDQVTLLIRVLPLVAAEKCFALKGGTAINLFVRDMPRLSVDIDLAYLPIQGRAESIVEVDSALRRIAEKISGVIPGSRVDIATLRGTDSAIKLIVQTKEAQIKVEVTPVLRGTVYPCEIATVSAKVQEAFGYAETTVVSFPDLYGGKLVAALDRQHPRDLYDVHILLNNEGLTRNVFVAFLVYVISHDRPMSEIIAPRLKDIRQEFERGFAGMTADAISLEQLEATRQTLITAVRAALTTEDKQFLLSIKRVEPRWDLLPLQHAQTLPAVQWKLQNLQRIEQSKRKTLLAALEKALGLE